jgi:hypothetical protein
VFGKFDGDMAGKLMKSELWILFTIEKSKQSFGEILSFFGEVTDFFRPEAERMREQNDDKMSKISLYVSGGVSFSVCC